MTGDPPSLSDELAAFVQRGQAAQNAVTFEIATAELRKLGITLARLPGEYRVNFHNGTESTARTLETLDEALAAGRAMAAERAEARSPIRGRGPRRRRLRRMTPRAYNKRLRMAQLSEVAPDTSGSRDSGSYANSRVLTRDQTIRSPMSISSINPKSSPSPPERPSADAYETVN